MTWELKQAKTAKWVIEQAQRQNRAIPESLLDRPELFTGLELYWLGFWDLHTCRPVGTAEGPISWLSISDYCMINRITGEQREIFMSHIRSMDSAYLEHRGNEMNKKTAMTKPAKRGNK